MTNGRENMFIATCDLSEFGTREIDEAVQILTAYRNESRNFFTEGLTLNLNKESRTVFLSDQDFNVGLLNGNEELCQWFTCPNCGKEGFDTEEAVRGIDEGFPFKKYHGYCSKECEEQNK
jgi:hypothetical protein